MKNSLSILILLSLFLTIGTATMDGAEKDGAHDTFEIGEGSFLLNVEPFLIKAAELHYPRIPREYWDHRIKMAKALGMNTICMYVFWNIHEQKEGEFDFTGGNDIREFIRLCDENGMKVILRPGPYVCAEWEMGGLPWWLLKNKEIKLRENDPTFIEKVENFEKKVAEQVADLTIGNGGPILMVQVENEYGAYGEDKEYVAAIRDILRKYYGDETVMFQCDWSSNFRLNGLDDLLWTMNFGTGADIDSQFKELKELRPHTPLMCSEFWSGWFDKWGANHETRDAGEMIAGIDEMLKKDISFSLYMTHGGTNWSHWAGANSPGYSPDVTSYDYDAPISENGAPTEKYWLLKETLEKYNGPEYEETDVPEPIPVISIDTFTLEEVAPLWENLPAPIFTEDIKTMEEFDMGFGSIIYSTTLPAIGEGMTLMIEDAHDYAIIFVNGEKIGTLDRRNGDRILKLGEYEDGAKLDILVEATGRINFGRAIKDYKGITEGVCVISENLNDSVELKNWDIHLLPDEKKFYDSLKYSPVQGNIYHDKLPAGVYRGKFSVTKPSDTFLNFETWGKGLVYVNGKGLGRIWSIGPQQTLYVPGPWLREGDNEIMIFDILGPETAQVEGLTTPIIDKIRIEEGDNREAEWIKPKPDNLIFDGELSAGNGWKVVNWERVASGKTVTIEIISTHAGDNPSIAELYLIDENGNRLTRENWKGRSSSQDTLTGNHTVNKIYDLQESTYWQASDNTDFPVFINVDLGEESTVSGLEYLPRMETGAPGSIRNIRIYIE